MKLIHCPDCKDVFRLFVAPARQKRFCKCGQSWGRYEKNGKNAITGGHAIPIGFDNKSFYDALKYNILDPFEATHFDAFVIPYICKTISREES